MWDYKSTDDFDDDYRDPIVTRTCFTCKGPVYCSIHDPYQVQVFCESCIRTPIREMPTPANAPVRATASPHREASRDSAQKEGRHLP